jgi:hypothetical protein
MIYKNKLYFLVKMNFMTTDNLKLIVGIFTDYMIEKHSVDVNAFETTDGLRKTILAIMNNVDNSMPHSSLQEKNMRTLSTVKDFFIKKYNITQRRAPPNIENLSRDQSVFGSRPMKQNILIPEANEYIKANSVDFNNMINSRNKEMPGSRPPPSQMVPPTKEVSESIDDFQKKLKLLQEERDKITSAPPPPSDLAPVNAPAKEQEQEQLGETLPIYNHHQQQQRTFASNRFININSGDRNWIEYPCKYPFTIEDDTEINEEYMSVSKVIIPMDSFNVPYVILNDTLELSFEKSFTTNNKRSFVVLEPLQKDKKIELKRLEFNIKKPNGDPLENTSDHIHVTKIETKDNNQNLCVFLNSASNSNIQPHDILCFHGFKCPKVVPQQRDVDIASLEAFINRKSGHEVLSIKDNTLILAGSKDAEVMNCLQYYHLNVTEDELPESNGILMNYSLQTFICGLLSQYP